MKGPSEYGQDTERNYNLALLTTIPLIHILCSEASKLLLDYVPAFHSLLAKSHFLQTKVHFLPLETSQEK